jgi:VIT1/CCC1 family predicted Fe2+/Mn2+ transporter
VLRQGPIPQFVHGVLEYGAGVLLIVAPFILGFDSGSATAVAIVTGVVLIVVAASTDGPTGLSRSIPVPVHFLLDFVLAGFLIASPFLFGYSDETDPTALFIALGVLHLLVTIGTRFKGPKDPRKRERLQQAEPPAG